MTRYLNEAQIRPWTTRYWPHSPDKDEDQEEFRRRIAEICEPYLKANKLCEEQGVLLFVLTKKPKYRHCNTNKRPTHLYLKNRHS